MRIKVNFLRTHMKRRTWKHGNIKFRCLVRELNGWFGIFIETHLCRRGRWGWAGLWGWCWSGWGDPWHRCWCCCCCSGSARCWRLHAAKTGSGSGSEKSSLSFPVLCCYFFYFFCVCCSCSGRLTSCSPVSCRCHMKARGTHRLTPPSRANSQLRHWRIWLRAWEVMGLFLEVSLHQNGSKCCSFYELLY